MSVCARASPRGFPFHSQHPLLMASDGRPTRRDAPCGESEAEDVQSEDEDSGESQARRRRVKFNFASWEIGRTSRREQNNAGNGARATACPHDP